MDSINNKENNDSFWDNGLSPENKAALNEKDKGNQELANKWDDIHEEYLRRYPLLAPKDASYLPDKFDDLIERIAKRTMRTPQEVKEEIQNWQPSLYTRYDREI